MLDLNEDIATVENARMAAQRLHSVLSTGSDEFIDWFRQEFGASPDLSIGLVYDTLLG